MTASFLNRLRAAPCSLGDARKPWPLDAHSSRADSAEGGGGSAFATGRAPVTGAKGLRRVSDFLDQCRALLTERGSAFESELFDYRLSERANVPGACIGGDRSSAAALHAHTMHERATKCLSAKTTTNPEHHTENFRAGGAM